MLFQKVAAYIVRNSMVERLNIDNFFIKGIREDHLARYRFALPKVTNQKVLDIACGEGYGTNLLSKTAKEAIGVDVHPNSISKAEEKYQGKNLHFIASDGIEYLKEHQACFDVIVCYETIEHLSEYEEFIHFLAQGLKKNGLLYISTPNKEFSDLLTGGTANPYHIHEFYSQELENLLKKYFTNTKHFRQRPIDNRHRFFGGIRAALFGRPDVEPSKKGFSGLCDVFVCTK